MATISPAALLEIQQFRYATKQFDASKQIPADAWEALVQSLILSPSSFGLQPWKFLDITCAETRAKLLPHAWGQKQVVDCSHFVVFCIRTEMTKADIDAFFDLMIAVTGAPREKLAGYYEMMSGAVLHGPISTMQQEWAARQVYIALGNFMTSAAALGIDTCPMEGFVPAEFDKVLGLEGTGYRSVVCCPAGYRAETDKYAKAPKVRFPASKVVEAI